MALKHQHAVRAGEMIFTCGQMDLNLKSNLQNHNDHRMQSLIAMAAIRALLQDLNAELPDLVKLNTFHLGNCTSKDQEVSARINTDYFAYSRPEVNGIPLQSFPHNGLTTKICAIAMLAQVVYTAQLNQNISVPKPIETGTHPCLINSATTLDR